jgi:L-asparagine transporter-like permease
MPDTNDSGLRRELTSFQQCMIAIGGIIGVGLFLGSGATIGLAGPGVVVAYLLAAIVALVLGLVLAEMAIMHPVAGAFGVYADEYVGPWAGFLTRLTYFFAETFALGAMVTAVGVYFGFWFPDAPSWIFMVVAATLAVGLNALHVGRFGFLESAFSTIKVAAIVLFVVLGAILIVRQGLDFGNLTNDGGFFPGGASGIGLALTLVLASFLGVEAVSITAAEAARPERTVPRALIGVVGTLIVVYIASMLVILTVTPWRSVAETGGTLTGSPFVKVFVAAGVPYAAGVMNLVVVSTALTAVISHVYLATRMLHSLAREGYAPAALGVVDERGVPMRALAGSTLGLVLAVLLAAFGRQAFLPLYGTGVAALLSIWLLIFFCHRRFRERLSPAALAALPIRVPGHPVPSILASVIIVAALAVTPWVGGLTWTVPMFLLWLAMAGGGYSIWSRRRGDNHGS